MKDCALLLVPGKFVKLGGLPILHDQIDFLFWQFTPHASEGGLAILTGGELDLDDGQARDLTELKISKHYVLLSICKQLDDEDLTETLQAAVLSKEATAADGSGRVIKDWQRLFGVRRFTQHVRDGGRLFEVERSSLSFRRQPDTGVFGKAEPVQFQILDVMTHCAATRAANELNRRSELISG